MFPYGLVVSVLVIAVEPRVDYPLSVGLARPRAGLARGFEGQADAIEFVWDSMSFQFPLSHFFFAKFVLLLPNACMNRRCL